MFVEELHVGATYFQRSSNLSSDGIFLEQTVPHPVGTRVGLQFTLPGDQSPIRVQAEIVSALEEDAHLGMGLRFIDPDDEVTQRIERFISERSDGTSERSDGTSERSDGTSERSDGTSERSDGKIEHK
jgi:uncharacterized protein (TIGR02266 family)